MIDFDTVYVGRSSKGISIVQDGTPSLDFHRRRRHHHHLNLMINNFKINKYTTSDNGLYLYHFNF